MRPHPILRQDEASEDTRCIPYQLYTSLHRSSRIDTMVHRATAQTVLQPRQTRAACSWKSDRLRLGMCIIMQNASKTRIRIVWDTWRTDCAFAQGGVPQELAFLVRDYIRAQPELRSSQQPSPSPPFYLPLSPSLVFAILAPHCPFFCPF